MSSHHNGESTSDYRPSGLTPLKGGIDCVGPGCYDYVMSYDAWLEKPYQDRYAQDALYEEVAEIIAQRDDVDIDEVTDDDILAYIEAEEEAAAEEAAERARDYALEMDYEDRYLD